MTNQKNAVKLKSLYTGLVIRHLLQFHEPENIFAFRLKTFDKNAKQSKHLNFFGSFSESSAGSFFCLKLASLADFSSSSLRNVLTIAAEAVREGGCLRSLFLIARRTVACNKIRQIIVSISPHRRADLRRANHFLLFASWEISCEKLLKMFKHESLCGTLWEIGNFTMRQSDWYTGNNRQEKTFFSSFAWNW